MSTKVEALTSSAPVPPAPAPRQQAAPEPHAAPAAPRHDTEPLPPLPAAVQQARLHAPPPPPVMSGEQMRAILDLVV